MTKLNNTNNNIRKLKETKDINILPVNLLHWEDDVIIDVDQARNKVFKHVNQ